MATATITDFVTRTALTTGMPSSTDRVSSQSGIIGGADPSKYDPKNPIIVFIIQAGIVISFCRLLHWPLSKLRQPRVIAEVVAGILLGPSVMGRIPGFTNAIFPTASIPNFTLVANIGLVLFLFLVGLEVDLRYVKSNWKVALSVGAGGMALPFGLGCALSWGLYHEFRNEPDIKHIDFPVYMLFVGVALAITAFPVLCRILAELKLLGTPVGIIVLTAGVANDVIGWILLALCVALVNSGTGLVALWIVLTCLGFALFLIFAVRPTFLWLLKKTHSIENGPSQAMLSVTLLLAFSSAFFTGIIGVHPIFGAFMFGLICPHEGQFSIKVAEKIEDLVNSLFLPLYFALSGLSTNLALLDNGITWAYVLAIIACAFFSKVIGGSLAARANGREWRESFTIGALMSCKGLVELIVLNIGLQASILSERTFTIFVVMALVTTFATTPITAKLYPPWYQQQVEDRNRRNLDWDTMSRATSNGDDGSEMNIRAIRMRKLLIHFRLDNMPELIALISLFGNPSKNVRVPEPISHKEPTGDSEHGSAELTTRHSLDNQVEIHGVRILHMTDRDSSVMRLTEAEQDGDFDLVVNTVKAVGRLNHVSITGEVRASTDSQYATILASRAAATHADLLVLPWSSNGRMDDSLEPLSDSAGDRSAVGPYQNFICETIKHTETNVAVFINNGLGGTKRLPQVSQLSRRLSAFTVRSEEIKRIPATFKSGHRVLVAYFGSSDDRLAVRLALRLACDTRVTTKIVHFKVAAAGGDEEEEEPKSIISKVTLRTKHKIGAKPSADGTGTSTPITVSESIPAQQGNVAFLSAMRSSLSQSISSRVTFDTVPCSDPIKDMLSWSRRELSANRDNNLGDIIIMGRNSEMNLSKETEMVSPTSSSSSSPIALPQCLGALSRGFIDSGLDASLLVVRASIAPSE